MKLIKKNRLILLFAMLMIGSFSNGVVFSQTPKKVTTEQKVKQKGCCNQKQAKTDCSAKSGSCDGTAIGHKGKSSSCTKETKKCCEKSKKTSCKTSCKASKSHKGCCKSK